MDDPTMLASAGLSTTGVALLLIVYRILKSVKGKKLVSSCCGRKLEMGVDVQDMTPVTITIRNPMPETAGHSESSQPPSSTA